MIYLKVQDIKNLFNKLGYKIFFKLLILMEMAKLVKIKCFLFLKNLLPIIDFFMQYFFFFFSYCFSITSLRFLKNTLSKMFIYHSTNI